MHKVTEDWYLNPYNMIYLEIISQKKPSNGYSNSWNLIQESDTKKNGIYSQINKNNRLKLSLLS